MTRPSTFLSLLAGAALALPALPQAGNKAPAEGHKSMTEVLRLLEERVKGAVTELEYKKDAWEAMVCEADKCHRLVLDAKTGAETSRKAVKADGEMPPAQALSLSAIVEGLELREAAVATEVEFDEGLWEADLIKDGKKKEYKVDPLTGQTKS